MLFLYSLAILCLSLFASAAPVNGSPKRWSSSSQAVAFEPVRFINHFGSSIPADTAITLEWTGGSGRGFDVYYIPQWPQQKDYYPVELVSGTTSNHFTWHTPKADEFPKGTTFILGVNDEVTSLSSDWYDITGMMNFAH
ncbi:uncharacterized protein I303_104989 [Kwoniella dejecticola CBS 10117]|uniref:Uncharacterized protein n=1 Tax=Kwoniella dejecticola CBS 10117 TaxID=1296121 RepID=A0A1A6A3S5_9TREE|nr:uncharacterized protein I303_05566 [Kwoniella dejecticola CBS 10117]OBR84707.1 hypothetical protein I303_05566 [Kwoniella dejecticola CBS 10117]